MKANESKPGCAREAFDVDWQSIDWNKVRRGVRSLQRRIVKATKEGRHNKVKALQWLLTGTGCVYAPSEGLSRMR
jgi:RNA-directed DNA polymerase